MPLPEKIVIEPDPVIEYYKQFVDREQIRQNLRLTVDERFRRLTAMQADEEKMRATGMPED